MKYMVMECHLSYAVVLDEDGRFLNVANLHYKVGQTVTEIIEMKTAPVQEKTEKKIKTRWIYSMATLAACLVLVFTAMFQLNPEPYASIYMTINPEVRIDVNKQDIVVGLEGINTDGEQLVENYNYKKKDLDLVMDELVDRAIDMGYLHEGGQITLALDAKDNEWVITKRDSLSTHLNEYLTEKMSVTIEVTDKNTQSHEVIIPIEPDTDGDGNHYNESDYGDTSSDPSTTNPSSNHQDGDSSYDDDSDDGQTDYGDTSDNSSSDDGQSNYDDSSSDDGQSNYDDSSSDDGQSSYDTPSSDDGQSNYSTPSSDDGQSNYSNSSSGDGQSNYDTSSSDDGQSNYDTSSSDDGQSAYETDNDI